jgi:hypothetical protein
MRHDDLAPVAEGQVTSPRQFLQAGTDGSDLSSESDRELTRLRRPTCLGERAIHGQSQILGIHAAILANPGTAAGSLHGFPPALTSFIGRALAVSEVAGLLDEHRLATVSAAWSAGGTRYRN